MHVLVGRLQVHLPFVHSLKEKRSVRLGLLGRFRRDFPAVAYAELEHQDDPKHLVLGVAVIGSNPTALTRAMGQLRDACEGEVGQPVTLDSEFR